MTVLPPPPGPPLASPSPSKSRAVWALVLSFLWCLPLLPIIAIVLAIGVLRKSRDGQDHGKGLAVVAIVLSVLGLLAAVGGGLALVGLLSFADKNNIDPGDVLKSELKVGECVNGMSNIAEGETGRAGIPDVVPCSEPHEWEVMETFDLEEGEYPGASAVDESAVTGCKKAFASYVGKGFDESELEMTYVFPQEVNWSVDDRSVQCMVGTGEKSTGSLKGANR